VLSAEKGLLRGWIAERGGRLLRLSRDVVAVVAVRCYQDVQLLVFGTIAPPSR